MQNTISDCADDGGFGAEDESMGPVWVKLVVYVEKLASALELKSKGEPPPCRRSAYFTPPPAATLLTSLVLDRRRI